jgi:hypothetical protein
MAYDADGNFYNPYQPGTFEYDYEESQRGQFAPDLTPQEQAVKAQKDAADIAAREAWYATPEYKALVAAGANEPGYGNTGLDFFSSIGKFVSGVAPYVLAVAPMVVPGLGQMVGAAILESVGLTGTAATSAASAVGLTVKELGAAVGATAISSANTVLQGGSVEDVLKSAAGAGIANGLNINLGGGVLGATAGSAAGTLIKGGDASQIITNALAAGVGAGVQDVLKDNPDAGKILGTAARTYIATGGNVDQTLLNTAAAAVGVANQPSKTAQQLQAASTPLSEEAAARQIEEITRQDAANRQELADYQEKLNQYNLDEARRQADYQEKLDQYNKSPAEYQAKYGVVEPAVAPVVASAVAAPTQDELSSQTIVAKSPDVAPVVTNTDLVKKVAPQPTPAVDNKTLQKVIVQGQTEVAPVEIGITAPVQTPKIKVPPVQPSQADEKLAEPGFEAYPITGPKLEEVKVQGYTEKPPEVVTDVPVSVAPKVVQTTPVVPTVPAVPVEPPPNTPKLDSVLIRAKAEPAPVVTDVVIPPPPVAPVAPTAPPVPPAAPTAPAAPAEPAKTTIYPTVTGVTSTNAPSNLTQSTQIDATANAANAAQTPATIPTFRVGDLGKYISPLASYEALVQQVYNTAMDEKIRQQPKADNVDTEYWGYGQQPKSIESMFDSFSYGPEVRAATGGSIAALMAAGGAQRTGIGSTALVPHSGKMRVDFRRGDAVTGPGDGQSDDIPAMLADGEFVFPADVVSALGNGSTKAGSDKLYEMMHSIRARARKAHPKSLPPPAKSPLEYLRGKK